MPSCLRQGKILPANIQSVYYASDDGFNFAQPKALAVLLLPDTVTTDLSKCSAVSLSGAEYQSLTSRITVLENEPASSTGGSTVNVTADIFVGAALVCIFVLGWIAGAQR